MNPQQALLLARQLGRPVQMAGGGYALPNGGITGTPSVGMGGPPRWGPQAPPPPMPQPQPIPQPMPQAQGQQTLPPMSLGSLPGEPPANMPPPQLPVPPINPYTMPFSDPMGPQAIHPAVRRAMMAQALMDPRGGMTTDQLNAASLQAAQAGQAYIPPGQLARWGVPAGGGR